MPPKLSKQKNKTKKDEKEWPLVVYMWAIGLGLVGYLVIGEMVFEFKPHPIHWLSGIVGGILGIGLGWIWFRWRGDVI
ncbi:MAG: hypothetical protein J0M11_09270 [Anaerolineae bacterium]|nr:hypothetical protein [Anaerolineae bacterium]